MKIEDEVDVRDEKFLESRLYEYNVARTGADDGRLLAIFLRDGDGAITAGLYGWTWGECLDVRLLWVREDLRARGLGRDLLGAAEREALGRGCRKATLETHSFQAPEFYRTLGYEVFATLEDYPVGHRKYYLRKALA